MSTINQPLGQTTFYTITSPQFVAPEQHDSGNIDIKLAPTYVPVTVPIIPLGVVPYKIKLLSTAHQPWIGFGSLENRIFLDDFCHQKDLTIKAQASSYNGAQIKLKQAVNIATKKGSKKIIKLKQEIKLWFPLYSNMASALHFRLTNEDSRIHYDHGIDVIHNHKVNFYGSFGLLRDWSKYNLKLGFQLLQKNAVVDNRIKIDNTYNVKWYHRTTANIDNLRLGLIAALDVTNRQLIKKDLFIGYRKDQFDVSLKAEQAFDKVTKDYSDWRQWFSRYYATAVFSRNKKQRYGVEVSFNPVTTNSVVTGLIEYLYSDKGITKIKLDNHLNLSFLVKKTLTDKLALSFGTQIPIVKKQDQRNKFGFQVDLNI